MLERAALSRQTARGSVTLSGTREQVGVERDGIAPVVGPNRFSRGLVNPVELQIPNSEQEKGKRSRRRYFSVGRAKRIGVCDGSLLKARIQLEVQLTAW